MTHPAWWEVSRPPSGSSPVEPDLGKEAGAVVWISSVPRFPHLQSGLGVPVHTAAWSPMLEEGLCDDGEAGEGQAGAEQGSDPPARSVTGGYSVNVGGGREPLAPTAQQRVTSAG